MCVVVLLGLLAALAILPGSATVAGAVGTCGLSQPALCETFDAPAGTGNRSGQLNGTLWGESHVTGDQNQGSPSYGWAMSQQPVCGSSQSVTPDHDAFICNGQLVEGQDDAGVVQAITFYPKQPFDFAGRTGKIVFDVSNDTQGNHSAWPELWITDQPVPGPFAHEAGFQSLPRNGLGIRFAGYSAGICPEGTSGYVGVDSAITISNYVENDTFNGGNLSLTALDCVKDSDGTSMNHYEVDISQNQIDVYGTDAGTTTPLKHLETINNANLNFTRGLVWIEDAHYNGSKFNSEGIHTFKWDNFGFDGPVLPRDLSYDVLDHLTPNGQNSQNSGAPLLDLGWFINANQSQQYSINGMADPSTATGSLLLFNFWSESAPLTFNYAINGHQHTFPWPYPDNLSFSPKTIAIPLVLTDLQAGTNNFSISPSAAANIADVNIALVGAGGGTPLPTPTSTPTVEPTPTESPTSVPTDTPVPTETATVTSTSVPTATPTPDCQVEVKLNGQELGWKTC